VSLGTAAGTAYEPNSTSILIVRIKAFDVAREKGERSSRLHGTISREPAFFSSVGEWSNTRKSSIGTYNRNVALYQWYSERKQRQTVASENMYKCLGIAPHALPPQAP